MTVASLIHRPKIWNRLLSYWQHCQTDNWGITHSSPVHHCTITYREIMWDSGRGPSLLPDTSPPSIRDNWASLWEGSLCAPRQLEEASFNHLHVIHTCYKAKELCANGWCDLGEPSALGSEGGGLDLSWYHTRLPLSVTEQWETGTRVLFVCFVM